MAVSWARGEAGQQREAGRGPGAEDGLACAREVSAPCETDVMACLAVTLLASFLIVLYS